MDPWASNAWDDSSASGQPLPSPKLPVISSSSIPQESEPEVLITKSILQNDSSPSQFYSWQAPEPPPGLNFSGWGVPSPTLPQDPTLPSSSSTRSLDCETPKLPQPIKEPSYSKFQSKVIENPTPESPVKKPSGLKLPSKPLSVGTSNDSSESNSEDYKTPEAENLKDEGWPGATNLETFTSTQSITLPASSEPETFSDDKASEDKGQVEDDDDDRWGNYAKETMFPPPGLPTFTPFGSSSQPSWGADTGVEDGWDPGVAIETPLDDHQKSPSLREGGWPLPGSGDNDDQNELDGDEPDQDPWSAGRPQDGYGTSEDDVGKQQVAARKWAEDQYPTKDDAFLPPGKAAMPLDLSSALGPGGELADTLDNLSQNPMPEKAGTRTDLLFENSATAKAFQSAISNTAAAAAHTLKSPSLSNRLFSITESSSSFMPNPDDPSATADATANQVTLGDALASIEIPPDAFEEPKGGKEKQAKKGFFGLWGSRSTLAAEASAKPTANETENNFFDATSISGALSSRLSISSPRQSISGPMNSISSGATTSSDAPSSTLVSIDEFQDPGASRMSRLFGKFGRWSKNGQNDPGDMTSPTTELNENDIQYLDSAATEVPISKTRRYDDFYDQPVRKSTVGGEVFDLLSEASAPSAAITSAVPKALDPLASTSKGKPNTDDLYDFFESKESDSKRRSASGPMKLSGQKPPTLLENLGVSPLPRSSSSTGQAPTSNHQNGDDIDDLFSEFQTSVSNRAQSLPRTTTSYQSKASAIDPKQRSTYNSSPLSIGQGGSKTSRLPTQVRMATSANTSHPGQSRSNSSNQSIPILAPPPLPPGSIPAIPRPQSQSPSLIPATSQAIKTATPPLLPPPPRSGVVSPIPTIAPPRSASVSISPIPPPQSSRITSPSYIPPLPPPPTSSSSSNFAITPFSSSSPIKSQSAQTNLQSSVTGTSSNSNSNNPGLSKQDLSFFDSLL